MGMQSGAADGGGERLPRVVRLRVFEDRSGCFDSAGVPLRQHSGSGQHDICFAAWTALGFATGGQPKAAVPTWLQYPLVSGR